MKHSSTFKFKWTSYWQCE